MRLIKNKKIENTIEDLIITGMIVDLKFLQEIHRAAYPEYFETDINRIIVGWIREYHEENKTAPADEMSNIFKLNQNELDEDEAITVRIFLNRISKEYEGKEFNSAYVLPKAFKYLELNAYRHKNDLVKRELRRGNLDRAKIIFDGASKDIFAQVTMWKSLSNHDLLHSWWGEKKHPVMSFPGELGRYMPNIERGRFYAMLGPPKRGKCLSENSLIHLSDGRIVPLKQMVADKITNILCKDEDNKIVPGKVIDWINSGKKTEYVITTKSGRTIHTSKEHRFFTPTGWKKLYELKLNDLVGTIKTTNINTTNHYMVPKNHPYLDNDILWDKIVKIKKGKKIQMFDLSIKGNHNFIADEFIVHNSFWLLEWAYNGIFDGLNVVFFSLEMNEHEVDARWKERISGKAIMEKKKNSFTIPVKDCVHNQKDDCSIPERVRNSGSVYNDKLRESYDDHPNHEPCTYCDGIDDIFEPTHWVKKVKMNRLTLAEAQKSQEDLDAHVGFDRLRILSFPISTASVSDLEKSLNELEINEGFIPDLIVIDYGDILKEDLRLGDKRHRVGGNWQELSRMAKTRNAVVVSASQGNRNSAKKNRLDVDDVSEDFSKIMTIDGIFAINEVNFDQPNKWQIDKNWQIQRIETIALRYGKFIPGLQCVVMNDLSRSQICLDSYINWR